MKLTDTQWEHLKPLFEIASDQRHGRPSRLARELLDGILWTLKTGARWCDLPRQFLPYQTCHRSFQEWVKNGSMEKAFRAVAQDLKDRVNWVYAKLLLMAPSAVLKKGSLCWENQARKGTKLMLVADSNGLSVAVCLASASPHEVKLVEQSLITC